MVEAGEKRLATQAGVGTDQGTVGAAQQEP